METSQTKALSDSAECCKVTKSVKDGDIRKLRQVFQAYGKCDSPCCTKDCSTALHFAATEGIKHVVQLLLHHISDVDVPDEEGCSPLMKAVQNRQIDIAVMLLRRGARIDAQNADGKTPVMLAVEEAYSTDLLTTFFKSQPSVGINLQDKRGETALMKAFLVQDLDAILVLLQQKDVSVDIKDSEGRTVADMAEMLGLSKFFSLLQEHKTLEKISRTDPPLILAIKSVQNDVVELLLETFSVSLDELGVECDTPLMVALKMGTGMMDTKSKQVNLHAVRQLLEAGAAVNSVNPRLGHTALMLACMAGSIQAVELLLKHKVSVNIQNSLNGYSALMYAIEHGCFELVQLLLQAGADVNTQSTCGKTPMLLCILLKLDACINLLFANGLKLSLLEIETATQLGSYGLFERYGDKILSPDCCVATAAKKDNMNLLKYMLDTGKPIDQVDGFGDTALFYAVRHRNVAMVEYLLEHGASVDFQTSSKSWPLREAVWVRDLAVVQLLLKHGANPDLTLPDGSTLLCVACLSHHLQHVAVALIEAGADLNANSGEPPLRLVARNGELDLLRHLLQHGADIHARDFRQSTALQVALEHPEAMVLLIEHGADINIRLQDSTTLVMAAIQKGFTGSLDLLLSRGADIHLRDSDGCTAFLHAAKSSFCLSCLPILLKQNVNVNDQDRDGFTALHHIMMNFFISRRNKMLLTSTLIEAGVDISLRDSSDDTVLHIATRCLVPEVVKVLIESGADPQSLSRQRSVLVHVICSFQVSDNYFKVLDILLEAGAKVNVVTSDVVAHFHRMIILGVWDYVAKLTSRGLSPRNIQCSEIRGLLLFHVAESLDRKGISEISPLCTALLSGRPNIAKYFIENWYFTRFDVTVLQSNPIFLELVEINSCRESKELLKSFFKDSKSLVELSFVTLSDHLGSGEKREDTVRALLPGLVGDQLLYQTRACLSAAENESEENRSIADRMVHTDYTIILDGLNDMD